jgi:Fe-S oxidoreductase
MVVLSPHCLDVFINEYPQVSDGFEPMHYTEYLAQLISEGRLKLEGTRDLSVAFQDPCILARKAGRIGAPREVLGEIAGLKMFELSESRENTLCCGGGGGRMWMETPAGERFADLRIMDARMLEVDILATACPFCTTCLEDSLNSLEGTNMRVQELAEIVLDALSSP